MKNRRCSNEQITGNLKKAESGVLASELNRKHGISNARFYKYPAKFCGVDASKISDMKALLKSTVQVSNQSLCKLSR